MTYTRLGTTSYDVHGMAIPYASRWLSCDECGAVITGPGMTLHDAFHDRLNSPLP